MRHRNKIFVESQMKKIILILSVLLFAGIPAARGQITGLSGWDVCLDPGHSQTENMGIYGYSEAEKNLKVAKELRGLLQTRTDIDTVYLTRTNNNQSVSLKQRVDYANNVNASWFHSIHSNAGSPSTNNALLLWPQHRDGSEVSPRGGKRMSEIMVDLLSQGMRIPNFGAWGECDFYGSGSCRGRNVGTGKGGSRNYVQSYTIMASQLSEAGFHTNPTQNQRNMNEEWKRLEAFTFFWSVLDYHGIDRPEVRIVTGIIRDLESDVPINGATVSLAGQSYTTDTYESLFYQYDNPSKLNNGFYFLENLSEGPHQMVVTAAGYYPDTVSVTMNESFFTFEDVDLISKLPPYVESTTPVTGDSAFPAPDPIVLDFSRPMDTGSVEEAFSITPGSDGEFNWSRNDTRLYFSPAERLDYLTEYTLTIAATATDKYGHPLDGNADSTGGDEFNITFRTGPEDMSPPVVSHAYPGSMGSDIELHPVATLAFNEPLDPESVSENALEILPFPSGTPVEGTVQHYRVREYSVLSLFPAEKLQPATTYMLRLNAGIRDLNGNVRESDQSIRFSTGDHEYETQTIDNFDPGVGNWWVPQQSGSTTGIITDSTDSAGNQEIVNLLTRSSRSLQIDYGWDTTATDWLIREYLSGGAPRDFTFDKEYLLQVYVFGDGSGNQFRFALDDNYPNASASNHEVSPWYTVDWSGWKLVTWDMANDGTGTWLGDGNLDGTLRFDSIQLTHKTGGSITGTLYFDDLRLATRVPTSLETAESGTPTDFMLSQNYPNPFNPSTRIEYYLPRRSPVHLAVYSLKGEMIRPLVNDIQPQGYHTIEFSGSNLPSGLYIYQLKAKDVVLTRKMSLIK